MPTVKGRSEVRAFLTQLPDRISRKILPGAGRAGGKVIAADAKERVASAAVADAVVVRTRRDDGRITVKVTVKPGWATSLGNWLEYGTSPHFISVSDQQRQGMSIGRINKLDKAARRDGRIGAHESLVINGKFVGETVFHPGSRSEPWLRPAFDNSVAAAIGAAQAYIRTQIGKVNLPDAPEDDEV